MCYGCSYYTGNMIIYLYAELKEPCRNTQHAWLLLLERVVCPQGWECVAWFCNICPRTTDEECFIEADVYQIGQICGTTEALLISFSFKLFCSQEHLHMMR